MPERRRIVPDNSVLIEVFFETSGGQQQKRARQFLSSILNRSVVCFAPDALMVEFVKVAHDFRGHMRPGVATVAEVDQQVESFLKLPIEYVPSIELVSVAIDLTRREGVPLSDSWYLAAASLRDAELWISHNHADGFTARSRTFHDAVYTLAADDFYSPRRT